LLGDVEVQDASAAVADDEEAIEHAKGDCRETWPGAMSVMGHIRFPHESVKDSCLNARGKSRNDNSSW
jgi:hypothetical protein